MTANLRNNNALIALILVSLAVWLRLLPHPPNFAPIAAIGIFSAVLLPRRYSLTIPLGGMILSDLIIGLHPLVLFTWGAYLLIVLLAERLLKRKITFFGVVGTALIASVLFFVITNFGVWLEGRLYARTIAGLWQCYYMAIPFFRNTLLGDLVYTGGLFGFYALGQQLLNFGKQPLIFRSLTQTPCLAKTPGPELFTTFSPKTVPIRYAFRRKTAKNSLSADVFPVNKGSGSGSKN